MTRHLGSRRTRQEGVQLREQPVIDAAMMTGRGREAQDSSRCRDAVMILTSTHIREHESGACLRRWERFVEEQSCLEKGCSSQLGGLVSI